MAVILRRICLKYVKCLGITVVVLFFAQIFVALRFFPSANESSLKQYEHVPLSKQEGEVSARKNILSYSDDEDFPTNAKQLKPASSLRVEELDFKPICEIQSREAISAVHRAKSQLCKQQIVNKTCLIQEGNFYPEKLTNTCPHTDKSYASYLGCFMDEKKMRLLSGFYGNYVSKNSPKSCLDICLQAGFPYAGVQYGSECFCGDTYPPENVKLSEDACDMKCPADPLQTCGGYFTMNIFETGLTKFQPQIPDTSTEKEEEVRIIFLLTLNGRAIRQVHRLINALYKINHFFYIHVDKRQDYLHRQLLVLEEQFPNIKLATKRFSTIWGGASLLTMLLTSMKDIFALKWKWDFVINLSESDFPIKSLEKLEKFLSVNKGLNFVKSHGREVQRFIKKQGLDKTFIECDTHMWRVGERKLPRGIVIDGGSDWIALSPDFVSYVVNEDDELLSGLEVIFQHTLLPAESFFHTALRNSRFCNTYVDNNLHVTNWKRKLGCKCQYKHVVDWCGCSPNDFKTEDWPRIQNTQDRQLFFARKFEPIINQEIINRVEQYIGFKDHLQISNLESYWQSIYNVDDLTASTDDTLLSHAESIIRHNAKILAEEGCIVEPDIVTEISSYNYADVYKGNLILHKVSHNNMELTLETWYKPKKNLHLNFENRYVDNIKQFKVSSDYDQKEMVFRNFAGILGPLSEPTLSYQLSSHALVEKKTQNLTIVWLDPTGVVADLVDIHVDENNLTNFIKPSFRTPLLPGIWKVGLFEQSYLIASTKFLVTPLQYFGGKDISTQEVSILHGGSQNSYHNYSHVKIENFIPDREYILLSQKLSQSNIKRTKQDLKDWIDTLNYEFYNVLGSCIKSSKDFADKLKCGSHIFDYCELTHWSSLTSDPKGSIGKLNKDSGRLDRI